MFKILSDPGCWATRGVQALVFENTGRLEGQAEIQNLGAVHAMSLVVVRTYLKLAHSKSPIILKHLSRKAIFLGYKKEKKMKREESSSNAREKKDEIVGGVLLSLILAPAILYGSGWSIIWGAKTWSSITRIQDFIVEKNVIAIRINNEFYGIGIVDRFFDSPVISWFGFGIAIMLFSVIFSLSSTDEEN